MACEKNDSLQVPNPVSETEEITRARESMQAWLQLRAGEKNPATKKVKN